MKNATFLTLPRYYQVQTRHSSTSGLSMESMDYNVSRFDQKQPEVTDVRCQDEKTVLDLTRDLLVMGHLSGR